MNIEYYVNLTPLENEMFAWLKIYIKENKGKPPTYREISDAFGLKSSGTAHRYISSLVKKGFISREARKRRSMHLTNLVDKH